MDRSSSEEGTEKPENDLGKAKYIFSKELVAKFPHAQASFKNNLEK